MQRAPGLGYHIAVLSSNSSLGFPLAESALGGLGLLLNDMMVRGRLVMDSLIVRKKDHRRSVEMK